MLIHGTEFLENNFFEKFNITLVAFVSVLKIVEDEMYFIKSTGQVWFGDFSTHISVHIFQKERGTILCQKLVRKLLCRKKQQCLN